MQTTTDKKPCSDLTRLESSDRSTERAARQREYLRAVARRFGVSLLVSLAVCVLALSQDNGPNGKPDSSAVGTGATDSGGFGNAAPTQKSKSSGAAAPAEAQKPTSKSAAKKDEPDATKAEQAPPAAGPHAQILSLDAMIAAALKDNPDILVADAKLREAEANLKRARLEVVQKVITARNLWQMQQAEIESAEAELSQFKRLAGGGGVVRESELKKSERSVRHMKAKLTEIEAELEFLLGRQPSSASGSAGTRGMGMGGGRGGMVGAGGDDAGTASGGGIGIGVSTTPAALPSPGGGGLPLGGGMSVPKAPSSRSTSKKASDQIPGPMAEKIRKAMTATVKADFTDKPVVEILSEIRREHGVPFVIPPNFRESIESLRVNLDLGEVPTGMLLQVIEDTLSLTFSVREYGIFVGGNRGFPGRGSSALREFWIDDEAGGSAGEPQAK